MNYDEYYTSDVVNNEIRIPKVSIVKALGYSFVVGVGYALGKYLGSSIYDYSWPKICSYICSKGGELK